MLLRTSEDTHLETIANKSVCESMSGDNHGFTRHVETHMLQMYCILRAGERLHNKYNYCEGLVQINTWEYQLYGNPQKKVFSSQQEQTPFFCKPVFWKAWFNNWFWLGLKEHRSFCWIDISKHIVVTRGVETVILRMHWQITVFMRLQKQHIFCFHGVCWKTSEYINILWSLGTQLQALLRESSFTCANTVLK